MQAQNKPRLGVLALMLEGYEPLFPGITARQHAYVEEVVSSLSEVAECVFPRVALSRADIEAIVAGFNAQGLDGILILAAHLFAGAVPGTRHAAQFAPAGAGAGAARRNRGRRL